MLQNKTRILLVVSTMVWGGCLKRVAIKPDSAKKVGSILDMFERPGSAKYGIIMDIRADV